VLGLIASGGKVADVARDLGVSGQTIHDCRNQDLVDRGERPGLRSPELAELQEARRRIESIRFGDTPSVVRDGSAQDGVDPEDFVHPLKVETRVRTPLGLTGGRRSRGGLPYVTDVPHLELIPDLMSSSDLKPTLFNLEAVTRDLSEPDLNGRELDAHCRHPTELSSLAAATRCSSR
jgi:hypothetical protein